MKKIITIAALFLSMTVSTSIADTVIGKVTFLGTTNELEINGEYEAKLRVRVIGTCGDATSKEHWFELRSGRMESPYIHNLANFRNIYSTLTAAQLFGKQVQIDGISCDENKGLQPAWNINVGIF